MICEYGCGKLALYQFKNGKWCCSKNISGCKEINRKQKEGNVGTVISEERRRNISNSLKGKKLSKEHRNKISNGNKGRIITEETRKKISIANSGKVRSLKFRNYVGKLKRIKINEIQERYPLFSSIEEMRYNPDKPEEKEIQVHCKNHNCQNSKEKDGWFTPTKIQLYERIRHIEKECGNGGSYLYCSDKCKNECPLFYLNPYRELQKQNNKESIYTEQEYRTFRKFVLERDNYICQYCGEKAVHVHHERPQKLEPFFALDPDYAWSVCKKCHFTKGHIKESVCSTSNIAGRKCL